MLSLGTFFKARLSRKLNVFLVCLFISVIIWLLISLSKSYTTEIRFPVEHSGFPKDRVVTAPLPDELSLEVRSHGFDLLAYKLFSRQNPVKVDLEELRYKDRKKRRKGYLPTSELLDRFSRQFPENTVVRDVSPDTLFVSLAPRKKKKVEVVPEMKLRFREQFRLADEIEVEPPRVTLSGPSNVLDTTATIETRTVELQDLHKDQELEVPLRTDSISKKVEADPTKVSLRIRVNEFTEGKVRIPLNYEKVPEPYTLKTYPDSVTVHYLVAFDNYEKVEASMFEAVTRFPKGEAARDKERLAVELRDQPSFVDIVRFEPERVEFIIRKER